MNKLVDRIDESHNRITLVMNSATETQEWLRAAPDPLPPTHYQALQWETKGKLIMLHIYPAPHPLEVVAQVTDHFDGLDETRLRWLCERAEVATADIQLSKVENDGLPKTITDALRDRLREKVPMPKGKLPVGPANKATQVRERVIVLDPDIAKATITTLEKEAAMANALNAFLAAKNKGASLDVLRSMVMQMKERKRAGEARSRQGTAGVLART